MRNQRLDGVKKCVDDQDPLSPGVRLGGLALLRAAGLAG